MATTVDYIEYVCDQVRDAGVVRYKKMFGEYMVYVNDKPILLVCDNTVFVKILPCLDALMSDAEKGHSYSGAKEHYILDIDNADLSCDVVRTLEPVTLLPKPRKKKTESTANGNDLLANLEKLHTTELGALRIKQNLGLTDDDVVAWCREKTVLADEIMHKGKNWYVYAGDAVITINAHSYTIITAHKQKVRK